MKKPGHMDGIDTLSIQFFDPSGAAAFKVFLTFGAQGTVAGANGCILTKSSLASAFSPRRRLERGELLVQLLKPLLHLLDLTVLIVTKIRYLRIRRGRAA